jgi:plastocyanin
MRRLFLALALSSLFAGFAQAEEVTIKIENFTFNPPLVTIKPGTTVTWINGDDIPHSVVENNKVFKSPPLDSGEKFSMVFTTAGAVDYFCGFHNHMTGKVIVQP